MRNYLMTLGAAILQGAAIFVFCVALVQFFDGLAAYAF